MAYELESLPINIKIVINNNELYNIGILISKYTLDLSLNLYYFINMFIRSLLQH